MQGAHQRITYVVGLDGVRALAVIAVVLFHSGYGWASGGFVGVSVFFTLSGYLITSLLLAEHRSEGRVALRRFYARRARRLLPASLLEPPRQTHRWRRADSGRLARPPPERFRRGRPAA